MRHLVGATAVIALCLVSACSTGGRSTAGGTGDPGAGATHGHGSGSATPPPAPLRDGEHFVNLGMPEPYTPHAPNGGTDEYRCFLVDPKLASRAFLTGSQFLPQNADVVHHAIFFRLDPDQVAEARQLDDRAPGQGWTCFGDAGVRGDAAWVGHWAPGANETLLTPGVGYPMPAGSRLVMQIHYNLLGAGGTSGSTDQSTIRLRLTDGATDLRALETVQVPAPVELPCAAGESGPLCDRTAAVADVAHRFGDDVAQMAVGLNEFCNGGRAPVAGVTQRCDHKVEQGGTAYAVAGHMHLLGRSIKVELNPATPRAQTLLDVPAYNFDDQAIQPLAAPVEIKAGDTVRVTCTHDAGLRKLLPQLRTLPPRYVVWGDGTSDEMCLGLIVVAH
jgi:hypothetical protein